ncbi:hypothetical protein GCM10023085_38000 [Actinomadura viridis]
MAAGRPAAQADALEVLGPGTALRERLREGIPERAEAARSARKDGAGGLGACPWNRAPIGPNRARTGHDAGRPGAGELSR